ncbi:MAG: M48 family metallopeptidase [Burkholderiaceae bacterium]
MNFFESQDRVRRNTVFLVFLFVVAVIALIIATNVLVMIVFDFTNSEQLRDGQTLLGLVAEINWRTFAIVSAGVSLVIVAGSLYKINALSAGGKVVAESLDGQLIAQNSQNPNERKLLNVVEEMAIASGTPVPPVYLLAGEPGINAFAAGFSPRDAVIGVTQGTIDHLSREQLQGVIAHEFSHIFNGDMRLNIRLMGALNGILVLGLLGYYLLYSASFSGRRRGNDKGAAGILALAIGLMVIGFAGTFFGSLIKASVSRQREYLADSSAVQFARNPNGIAGALKRIGGLESGSTVQSPGAPEVSHAFFAQGISGPMQWLAATHPPLEKRILRIDPGWNGQFDLADQRDLAQESAPENQAFDTVRQASTKAVGALTAGLAAADAMTAIDQIGTSNQEAVHSARLLVAELPKAIRDASREPYGARAILYCMALDNSQTLRLRQLAWLQEYADPNVYELTRKLMTRMLAMEIGSRLPVIDIAIAALKQLSISQYEVFKKNLMSLIDMDARVDLMEWSLQTIVLSHLDEHFLKAVPTRTRHSDPNQLKLEFALVLSLMAHAGASEKRDVPGAFSASVRALEMGELTLLPEDQIGTPALDIAMGKLNKLPPQSKSRLLKSCVASIWHDQMVTTVEMELVRAFAAVLDCPIPLNQFIHRQTRNS